jgi:hypothetical protein
MALLPDRPQLSAAIDHMPDRRDKHGSKRKPRMPRKIRL